MEAALMALLGPLFKYLVSGGERAAEEAGRRAGEETWELAKRVWNRLTPRVRDAVGDVAADPDDARARSALELQLEKLIAADASAADELAALLAEARRSAPAGDVAFHGTVRADRGGVVAGHVAGGISTAWSEDGT